MTNDDGSITWTGTAVLMPEGTPAPDPIAAIGPPPIPVAVTLALTTRMKLCPHWEASSSCGCGVNRCRLGRGQNGDVTHQDCFDCLTAASSSRQG